MIRATKGNAVRFYIHMEWRRTAAFGGSSDHDHKAQTGDSVEVMGAAGSAAGPVMFDTGDNKEHRVVMTVTDYSAHPADDYVYGYAKIMHAYPTQSNGRRPSKFPWQLHRVRPGSERVLSAWVLGECTSACSACRLPSGHLRQHARLCVAGDD